MAVVESNAPLPENKPTRQWDAWTREEEENFFGALRQVGKNFEKITSRVQSKNKDQVRHYYYRVIKRMNKILSPNLVLDAKNSSYVNSAMLRWWSLLEKHSCSASKLRLKPRRFKTFVTALEHQLLKDRKKPKKKPPASASSRKHSSSAEASDQLSNEVADCTTSGVASFKAPVDELHSSQSVGVVRRTAVKRKAANNGTRKSGVKGEAKRPPRPRKEPSDGKRSKAANAKWEKEASVGVTLVADAAEQVERDAAAVDNLPDSDLSNTNCTSQTRGNGLNVDPQTGQIPSATSAAFSKLVLLDKFPRDFTCENLKDRSGVVDETAVAGGISVTSGTPPSLLPSFRNLSTGGLVIIPELSAEATKSLALLGTRCNNCSNLRCSGADDAKVDSTDAKVKLQLFPFDDSIRKALEQDGHNPHLELTLKARKSIPSVLNHLTQKWGRASVASGELRLFPFHTQWSIISAGKSWSHQDSDVTAADVHAALGNPAVFRLRYAWLSSRVLQSSAAVLQQPQLEAQKHACDSENLLPVGSSSNVTEKSPPGPGVSRFPTDSTLPQSLTIHPPGIPVVRCSQVHENTFVSQGSNAKTGTPSTVHGNSGVVRVQSVVPSAVPVIGLSVLPISPAKADSEIKPNFSVGTVFVESNLDKESQPNVTDVSSIMPHEGETIARASCKLQDGAAQLSGCGWLYESTDGFAQQLWSLEDPLRSNQGVSMSQMDWVDSLTNISVSELLGDGVSHHEFQADSPQRGVHQTQLTVQMDSFDATLAAQESQLNQPPSAIWGGEETCDAFLFQKGLGQASDHINKGTTNSLGHDLSVSSLGLDVNLSDFRSIGCWREQLQCSQNQDLFGGEASIGLGGLIEALAHGSLDGFQADFTEDELRDLRLKEAGAGAKTKDVLTEMLPYKSGKGVVVSRVSNGGEDISSPMVTSKMSESFKSDHCRDNSDSVGGTNTLSGSVQARETELGTKAASPQSKKHNVRRHTSRSPARSPPRSFKLPGQYTNVRSLKLQT